MGGIVQSQFYSNNNDVSGEYPSKLKKDRTSTHRESFSTEQMNEGSASLSKSASQMNLPVLQRMSTRQQDFEQYSSLLTRRFQAMERLQNEKLKKQYSDFLTTYWLDANKSSLVPTRVQSPVDESNSNNNSSNNGGIGITGTNDLSGEISSANITPMINIREEFDHLIMDMLIKKVPALEVYDTVFADYHVILKDDAQNKVMMLTQLKTRDAASYLNKSVTSPSSSLSEIPLSNPLLTVEQARDLLLLGLWPIFNDMEKSGLLTPLLTPEPSTFSLRNSLNLGRTKTPTAKDKQQQTTITATTATNTNDNVAIVTLFEPLEDDSTPVLEAPVRRRSLVKAPPKPAITTSAPTCKTKRPFEPGNDILSPPSSPISSETVSKEQREALKHITAISRLSSVSLPKTTINTVPINIKASRIDLERYNSLLSLYDRMSGLLASNTTEFLNCIKTTGRWCNSTTFFQHLENINVAIAIHSVEDKSSFFPMIYVNKAWETMTGYNRTEVLGQDIKLLTSPFSEKSQLDKIDYCMEEGFGLKVGINHLRKGVKGSNNQNFFNFFSFLPIYDNKGEYRFIISKSYDVCKSTACLKEIKYSEEIMYLIGMALRYL